MGSSNPSSLLSRVFRAIIFGVGGAVGSRVFMLLANILLSNELGPDAFGRFSTVNDTVNLFVNFSSMSIAATLTRYIAANRQDKQLQGIYIRTLAGACVGMSLALSAALMLFAPQISHLVSGTGELSGYFRLVAVAVFFASAAAVEQSVMLGYEHFAASSAVQLIRCVVYCGLSWVMARRYGIYGGVVSLVVTHGLQYVLSFVYNHIDFKKNAVPLRLQWDANTRNALLGFALPTFAAGLFALPVNWIGTAILIRTTDDFTQKAIFTVALSWMTYITYIPSQMGQMRPIYTDLYASGDRPRLQKLLVRTLLITTLAAAVVGGGVLVLSKFILGLYGPGYESGQLTLAFMILAAVLYTAQVQTGFLLQATGRMWIGLAINVLWAVSLLGCYLCLTGLGALGYAISYCVAYAITLTLQLLVALRELGKMKTLSPT